MGERWSKPHVATSSLHALLDLRKALEDGTAVIDLDADTDHGCINQVAGQYSLDVAICQYHFYELRTGSMYLLCMRCILHLLDYVNYYAFLAILNVLSKFQLKRKRIFSANIEYFDPFSMSLL
jgi:hypothetical protein